LAISGSTIRIGHVTLRRDSKDKKNWLVPIPEHAIQALNLSTTNSYGTSFRHMKTVCLHMLGGGTATGGTASGIFLGTGAV
jgi:hypothetical protein